MRKQMSGTNQGTLGTIANGLMGIATMLQAADTAGVVPSLQPGQFRGQGQKRWRPTAHAESGNSGKRGQKSRNSGRSMYIVTIPTANLEETQAIEQFVRENGFSGQPKRQKLSIS